MKSKLLGLLAVGLFAPLLAPCVAPVQAQMLMVWGDDTSRQISDAPDGKLKAVAGGSINGLALLE